MDLAMSILPPRDLVLAPDLSSSATPVDATDPTLSRNPDRLREQLISRATSRPIGVVRTELEQRATTRRRKEDDQRRKRHDPGLGMMPVPEREQHGLDIDTVEIITRPAETRPVYCNDKHQVEQRVVRPAETQRCRRITTPVEHLRKRGKISDATAAYAERWHGTWALAEAGFRSCLAGGVGREPGGLPEATVIAASDLRAAAASVGKIGHRVLTEMVGHEMSIQQMAKLHKIHHQEMTGICQAVLERLTEHYET